METLIIRTYRIVRPMGAGTQHAQEHGPELTGEEARQGVISGRVAAVLFSSLALAGVAGAVLMSMYF